MAGQLNSRFRAAEESPGLLLWQLTNRWQAAQRAALKPFGITHVQFVLLASLTWLAGGEPITQRRLSEHAATDVMMTSQVLRALEQRGLLVRKPHPSDGRAHALAATADGIALANRAIVAVERCDREFFAPLGDGSSFARDLRALLRSDAARTG